MAEELGRIADELEHSEDFDSALQTLVCRILTEHQRVIFNGNGYSEEWKYEAAKRGLSNLPYTAVALPTYICQKNIDLVTKHGIFTEAEFRARYEIHVESYCKVINIEARTAVAMTMHQILPAAYRYTKFLCDTALAKNSVGAPHTAEDDLITTLSKATESLYADCQYLQELLAAIPGDRNMAMQYYHDQVVNLMESIRFNADILEQYTDKSYWPYPTYSDLLYY